MLGLAGLAGAFPASPARRALARRVALGALGYWWLVLAEPLLGTAPVARAARRGSAARGLGGLAHQRRRARLGPLLTLGVLLGALLWARRRVVLPWIVRGRTPRSTCVAATVWAAALLVAAARSGRRPAGPRAPPGAARRGRSARLLGGVLAVGARALRGPV